MKRSRCAVVPAAVVGCYEAWPIHKSLPSLVGHRILVAYGEPIGHEELLRDGADAALARIEREVTRLRVALEAERDRD
jgi:1-acyl-sn-glycerol-3-phosphate acyltransferase